MQCNYMNTLYLWNHFLGFFNFFLFFYALDECRLKIIQCNTHFLSPPPILNHTVHCVTKFGREYSGQKHITKTKIKTRDGILQWWSEVHTSVEEGAELVVNSCLWLLPGHRRISLLCLSFPLGVLDLCSFVAASTALMILDLSSSATASTAVA